LSARTFNIGGLVTAIITTGLLAGGPSGCGARSPQGDDRALVTPPGEVVEPAAWPDGPRHTTITRIQVWSLSSALLYPSDAAVKFVEAKDAVYQYHTPPRPPYDRCAAVVFTNPTTGHVWIGPRTDYYLDTPDGLVGLWLSFGDVQFVDNGIKSLRRGDTLDSLAREFERQKLYLRLLDWPSQSADPDIREFVHYQFFDAFPGSAAGGNPHVESVEFHGQTLVLRWASPTYAYHVRLLIDVKTRSLIKAVDEDGFEAPPSILQHLADDVPPLRPADPERGVSLQFGDHSVTGFYMLRTSALTKPADESNAELSVTLSSYDDADQAKKDFQEMAAAGADKPKVTQSETDDVTSCRWPDGRILECFGRNIVDVQPKVRVPAELEEKVLNACVRRWTQKDSSPSASEHGGAAQ